MRSPFRALVPLSIAAILAACGGGGGGGGGGGSPNPAPPAFVVSDANAKGAAAGVIRVLEQAGVLSELPLLAADTFDQTHQTSYTTSCGTTSVTFSYTDADANSIVSAGDTLRVEHSGSCAGAARELTMRLTSADAITGSLAGDVTFAIDTDAHEHMTGGFALSSAFDQLNVTITLTRLAVTSVAGGKTDRLVNTRFERRFERTDRYRFDFDGRLESETLGGNLAFATTTPFAGAAQTLPDAGELILTVGATRVRVNAMAGGDSLAEYRLDTGTGFGPPQTVRWRDLTPTGLLFGWEPNDPPVIETLEIAPAAPTVEDTLTAGFTASDPDGDTLTYGYQWYVGAETFPKGANPTFPLAAQRRGDTIKLLLTAFDNGGFATKAATVTIVNAAPRITRLTISPAAPRLIDDLTATATGFDADGDALGYTYEWRVNGTLQPGKTGPVLPHGAYRRSDSVTVTAHASDGVAAGSLQASTTIVDAPPMLSAANAPEFVAYARPATFTVTVADPDGDSVAQWRFRMRYGPAGMTVNPTTGVVSWPGNNPMFDSAMRFNWSIDVDAPVSIPIDGAITISDQTHDYPLARAGFGAPAFDGLEVGDFDGDNDEEMLVLSQATLYLLERSGSGYRQSWMYPFDLRPDAGAYALATADIDGDHHAEIFVADGNQIVQLDGVERRARRAVVLPTVDDRFSCHDLEAADLDRDGAVELVCSATFMGLWPTGNDNRIFVLDAQTLAIKGEAAQGAGYGGRIAIGNVDNDPALEIVTSNGWVLDGATLATEWQYAPGFGITIAVGDVNGDGVAEIFGTDFSRARAYSALPTLRAPLFDIPALGTGPIAIADVVGNSGPEIVIANNTLEVYRYDVPSNTAVLLHQVDTSTHDIQTLAIANVNQDAADGREIVFASYADQFAIVGLPSASPIEWTARNVDQRALAVIFGGELARSAPAAASAPLYIAFDGNGATRFFTMQPTTGDLTFAPPVPDTSSAVYVQAMTVTDYDHDGADDVFFGAGATYDQFYGAYDFFGGLVDFKSDSAFYDPAAEIAHADLNGDGRDDLIGISSTGVVSVYDVFAKQLIWRAPPLTGGHAVAVANINHKGGPEIIAASDTQVIVFSHDANPSLPYVQIDASEVYDNVRDLAVGDVDGDGAFDLFLLHGWSVIERLDERLDRKERVSLLWVIDSLAIEDSTFARKNLLAMGMDPAHDNVIVALDPQFGAEVWRSPGLVGLPSRNSVRVVDIGGVPRMSYTTPFGVFLTR